MHLQAKFLLFILFQFCITPPESALSYRYQRSSRSSGSDGLPSSFGSAKMFHPLPGTVVGAHCKWEVKLNTVYNRIPQTITEILCLNPLEGINHDNFAVREHGGSESTRTVVK